LTIAARCLAGTLRHAGKALWAASSAARASGAPLSGTSVMTSPVAGSVTARRAVGVALQAPPMKLALRIRSVRVRVSGMAL